jgi:hypothetical protein
MRHSARPGFRWLWALAAVPLLALGVCAASAAAAENTARFSAGATASLGVDDLTATSSPTPSVTATRTPSPSATATVKPPTPTPTLTATATLTPTLSPEEAFNANFPVSTGSKLSLHFVRGSPGSYQFLQTARPAFVKLVDAALAWSPDLRREFPAMIQIGRVTDAEDASLLNMNPVVAANEYFTKTLHYYQQYPTVDYWEGWNEYTPSVWGSPQEWGWFAEFEAQRACLMQHFGYHAVIGDFSTGRPEFNEMLLFVPALRIGHQCGAIFGLHEYSAPTLQYGFGLGIPHRPDYPDRGMLTLRYRYWYEDILKPLNIPIPLVITEFGVDGGVGAGRPGPTDVLGWRQFGKYWKQIGLGDDPAQAYVGQLAWYDSEMRKDPYVLGAAIFNAGAYDNSPFEVETLLPDLTAYMVSMQGK